MDSEETVETILGELIVALTEEAVPLVRDEKEAYNVVAFALTHLLTKSSATPKATQMWH